MRVSRPLVLLPLLVLFAGCAHVAPAPPPAAAIAPGMLHSPWDATPVTLSQIPYDCGPAPFLSPDMTITGSLNSKEHPLSQDVKNSVYSQSATAFQDLTGRVLHAADIYRDTGSQAAAQCAINLLAFASRAQAMTGYIVDRAGWAKQNIFLRSMAIGYLKVRGANVASPQQTPLILNWMETIVRSERSYFEQKHCGPNNCDYRGHLGLSTAMAAGAIGIAANDPGLFRWSTSRYRSAIGDIDGRGTLHYDNIRVYALKFNDESAAALVQIAEFGEINGEPLYGYDDGRIHLLVHTVALGIVSPGLYKAVTNSTQKIPGNIVPWEISWASVYNRRFPDPVVTSLLQQVGPGGSDVWGGEPWDPEGEPEDAAEAQ
jgi:poly(beta-D-mannuronate) lyase